MSCPNPPCPILNHTTRAILLAYHGAQLAGGKLGGLRWFLETKSPLYLPADTPNYKDLVAVVYLSHRADLTIRLDICRKVSRAIGDHPSPSIQRVQPPQEEPR